MGPEANCFCSDEGVAHGLVRLGVPRVPHDPDRGCPGADVSERIAVIPFDHCTFEVWGPDAGHHRGHVRTVFPDGLSVPAAPNGDETIWDTACHELSHVLVAQIAHGRASVCLRAVAEGQGRIWTAERRAEEDEAYALGLKLAGLFASLARAEVAHG